MYPVVRMGASCAPSVHSPQRHPLCAGADVRSTCPHRLERLGGAFWSAPAADGTATFSSSHRRSQGRAS